MSHPSCAVLISRLKRADVHASVLGLLQWDEQVNLPPDSGDRRAEQLALLAELHHRATTDAATGDPVAPTNVVILSVPFVPLGDGSGSGRLDAGLVGEGDALVFRAGELVRGRWRKAAFDAPTELLGPASGGRTAPIALAPGQTFIQVVPTGTPISVRDPAAPAPTARPTPVPYPGSPS